MGEDAEILYNLAELYLLEHDYEKARQIINHYKKMEKQNKLLFFDKKPEFYKEKMELFDKFLTIV
jgi:hypothetical protein